MTNASFMRDSATCVKPLGRSACALIIDRLISEGWSKIDIATRSGVDISDIRRISSGQRKGSPTVLRWLALTAELPESEIEDLVRARKSEKTRGTKSHRPTAIALNKARRAAGMSLRDVAAKTGLSFSRLSDIERGKVRPGAYAAAAIARVLPVTASKVG